MIVSWSGSIVSIPSGWALCDGNNGTPDLTDKFVPGGGGAYTPGDTGGSTTHVHTFTGDGHNHDRDFNGSIPLAAGYQITTNLESISGTADAANNVPRYYALAYIMKL